MASKFVILFNISYSHNLHQNCIRTTYGKLLLHLQFNLFLYVFIILSAMIHGTDGNHSSQKYSIKKSYFLLTLSLIIDVSFCLFSLFFLRYTIVFQALTSFILLSALFSDFLIITAYTFISTPYPFLIFRKQIIFLIFQTIILLQRILVFIAQCINLYITMHVYFRRSKICYVLCSFYWSLNLYLYCDSFTEAFQLGYLLFSPFLY